MTIELGERCRVTVSVGFDMKVAVHLLKSLMGREWGDLLIYPRQPSFAI
jgi:hypothetical protein